MKKKIIEAEYRAETIKSLEEKRGALIEEMDQLIGKVKEEVRAFTEEENKRISELEEEVKKLNATIDTERRAETLKANINLARNREAEKRAEDGGASADSDTAEAEQRAFMTYIRSGGRQLPEVRAGEQNVTMGNNGAIIPTSIAKQIISKVNELCPIMAGATKFAVKGTLKVPVWGLADGHDITVDYQEEFTDITADAGKFTSVDLTGHLIGALVLIGKSVINNSEVDITNFIVSEIAKKIASFNEKELLNGTEGKMVGALSSQTTLTASNAASISADELIELQSKIPTSYQANSCWTMNPETFLAIKKLKDSSGRYLLLDNTSNITNAFPYILLGKPVYLSDNMPKLAEGAKTVLYGDYSGLGVNMREQMEMQILNEKYATQHAVGITSWYEMDSNVIDHQKLAVLVQKGAG